MSVAITLWMYGMCLSPIPWMLCSPNPLHSSVGHSSASTATVSEPKRSFSVSPAASVPAEPEADTKARTWTSGWAATIASIARPVASRWAMWFPNSQNWLRTTFAGSSASAVQVS